MILAVGCVHSYWMISVTDMHYGLVSACGYNVCTDIAFVYSECLYHYKDSVIYICNSIFVQWNMGITWNVVCKVCIQYTCHMVDASCFSCGAHVHVHPLYMPIKYMTYMWNVMSIFVSGTYMALTYEVDVVVGKFIQCYIYIQKQNEGIMICICDVAAIYIQWYMATMWNV